jgi:hypothetical protein
VAAVVSSEAYTVPEAQSVGSQFPREVYTAGGETIPESLGRYDELQRANLILMKAKESQYKKGQYLKNKYEKKLMQMQV